MHCATNSGGVSWTVTGLSDFTTARSRHCLINRSRSARLPVAVVHPTRGLTMNVEERNNPCEPGSAQLDAMGSCPTRPYQLSRLGGMNGGVTPTSFGACDQPSGLTVSKKCVLSPAVCGSPSTRYLVVAVLLQPTSTLQPFIGISTIKLPVFELHRWCCSTRVQY